MVEITKPTYVDNKIVTKIVNATSGNVYLDNYQNIKAIIGTLKYTDNGTESFSFTSGASYVFTPSSNSITFSNDKSFLILSLQSGWKLESYTVFY